MEPTETTWKEMCIRNPPSTPRMQGRTPKRAANDGKHERWHQCMVIKYPFGTTHWIREFTHLRDARHVHYLPQGQSSRSRRSCSKRGTSSLGSSPGEYVEDLQLVDVLNKASMGSQLLRPGLNVKMPRTLMRSKVIAHPWNRRPQGQSLYSVPGISSSMY